MQVASSAATPSSPAQRNLMPGETSATPAANNDPRLAQYKVIRRNGAVVAFEPSKILTPQLADLQSDVRKIASVLDDAYEILRDGARRERYRRAIDAIR